MAEQSSLGEELRRLRVEAGLTLADLSARSRVRQEYLAAIEENREEPSALALRRIANQLDSAGASYERLAGLLTAPEPDRSGKSNYNAAAATAARPRSDVPRQSESAGADGAATAIAETWRHKTDFQVVAAADSIGEYSEEAQSAIRAELERRGLARSTAAVASAPLPDSTRPRERQDQNAIRLFEVDGITVFLHWSWLLVAVYEIGSRQGSYSSTGGNILEYLSLFAIVLLHEFGHVIACRSVGGRADRIMLWPLGGVAYVQPPPRPGATLWSIAAGPIVNVLLVPIIGTFWAITAPAAGAPATDLHAVIGAAARINLGLLVFNLVPVYPLDGGQILGALLWFVFGRARGLMIATAIGFVGVAGLVLLALRAQSPWLGFMAFFVGSQCLAAFKRAQVSNVFGHAVARDGFACPACEAKAPFGPFWPCAACGAAMDPFDGAGTAPDAVCRACRTAFSSAVCFNCGTPSLLRDWRLSSRTAALELPGGVVRFRAPQAPSATPVVVATCLSFFCATTIFVAVQAASGTPTVALAMFAASVFLAARAAVLVGRFRRSRREFERAMQQYQAAGSTSQALG